MNRCYLSRPLLDLHGDRCRLSGGLRAAERLGLRQAPDVLVAHPVQAPVPAVVGLFVHRKRGEVFFDMVTLSEKRQPYRRRHGQRIRGEAAGYRVPVLLVQYRNTLSCILVRVDKTAPCKIELGTHLGCERPRYSGNLARASHVAYFYIKRVDAVHVLAAVSDLNYPQPEQQPKAVHQPPTARGPNTACHCYVGQVGAGAEVKCGVACLHSHSPVKARSTVHGECERVELRGMGKGSCGRRTPTVRYPLYSCIRGVPGCQVCFVFKSRAFITVPCPQCLLFTVFIFVDILQSIE